MTTLHNWNLDQRYKNRVFSMYWYIPEHTGTYWYALIHTKHKTTYHNQYQNPDENVVLKAK
jgi:hypothetical protein